MVTCIFIFIYHHFYQGQNFRVRIGANTGDVVSGVLGSRSLAFDLWGDTVNIAARCEANSAANGILITESTHDLVKDFFKYIYICIWI